ncbi:MAG: thioredoxin family protein [Rhodopirellula sp.]|nr:thioredoxin family protein [Rhodopirellula sp.]
MKPFKNYFSCAIHCAIAVAMVSLSGCGDSAGVDETAKVTPPAPPVSVAPGNDGQQTASTSDMPEFSDEPDFSDSTPKAETRSGLAAVTPPAPETSPGLDPLRLPEPAPVDKAWRKQWITSFEAAKVQAQKQNKDILVNFTGSDWCTWCIRLAQEVFSRPGFADYAQKNFILVEADFPQNQLGQPEAIDPQHQELADRYEFQGFPTIMLFDKQGRPFAQTGYQPGGPEAYNAHLDEFRQARVDRDTAVAAAEKLEGVERAKMLDEALATLPPGLLFPAYESVVEEIIKLDADNSAELRSQYQDQLANHQFMTRIQAIEKQIPDTENPDAVLADIAKVAKEFGGDPRRTFITTMFQLNVLNYFDRIDEVLTVAAAALKSEALEPDYQAQLYISQLKILNQADRQKDAVTIIDQAIEQFKDNNEMKMEFFLARADFLQRLDRTEEARAAVAEARKAGGAAAAFRIDQFEQSVLGSVSTDAKPSADPQEKTPADSAEKPAAATEKPSTSKSAKPDDAQ